MSSVYDKYDHIYFYILEHDRRNENKVHKKIKTFITSNVQLYSVSLRSNFKKKYVIITIFNTKTAITYTKNKNQKLIIKYICY
jgi:hypothetical protein